MVGLSILCCDLPGRTSIQSSVAARHGRLAGSDRIPRESPRMASAGRLTAAHRQRPGLQTQNGQPSR
eukprot:5092131-Alexandrium_andersonii.AAC.1